MSATNPAVSHTPARAAADDLRGFIQHSPTPWHAVAEARARLLAAGFVELQERDSWSLAVGGKYLLIRDDSSLIAFVLGSDSIQAGVRIIGAHTDSPGLRVKAQGAQDNGGYLRLNCEVYGSPILATFSDRDLALAGRVLVRDGSGRDGVRSALVNSERALVRLPNLPIHLNKNVNEDGLKLHKHRDLNLLLASFNEALPAREQFSDWLASAAGCQRADLLGFELLAYDAQPGSFFGREEEFLASRQLDNLGSCHAALDALLRVAKESSSAGGAGAAASAGASTQVIALFDHEEVGSSSYHGADGDFLQQVLLRIAQSASSAADASAKMLANSWLMSADMAHAWHPSHQDCYDGLHHLKVNAGVALKMNSSQRYATNALGEALFMQLAERAQVPVQKYVHRADLSCGTTIGPISAARLGIRTLDVGVPMWAMHSARESCGARDHGHYIDLMRAFLQH
ncbi:M18 family aminopeptidase [Permianibacter sp. IMCC34836]|uniref:M18 family aminopeptidase n=1 Tax=Permianibacter fluminis TaxID=2738515 RepID=UPI00155689D8|nr:M18 family aminopeptidase [Permianibacter fluminis]NQD38858.1 M18 family aminopeptidase [Permianibacter fluminis]